MSQSPIMSSGTSARDGAPRPGLETAREPDREYNWPLYALASGVVGAFVVALTFLVADVLAGRPVFWTPAVLGTALFMGEALSEGEPFRPLGALPIVFAYTLMHGMVFLGFGALVAAERLTRDRSADFDMKARARMSLMVFVGLEVTFLALGWIVGSGLDLAGRLGSGWIAVANALAAIAMTATIARAAQTLSERVD